MERAEEANEIVQRAAEAVNGPSLDQSREKAAVSDALEGASAHYPA
jgi:hypothetical protein